MSADITEPTIDLLNQPSITYGEALNTDKNIIHEAQHVEATKVLYQKLWKERSAIKALTKHHLGLDDRHTYTVANPSRWIRGGFNVCIPVEVRSPGSCRKLVLRCAMPHKLAEADNPGTIDEKMGCEIGAYVWIQENCPDIRIPHLYGFGFSNHRHFTHETHRSYYVRIVHYLQRFLHRLIKYPTLLSRYIHHPATHLFTTAYMLLEDVRSDTSQMLSITWNKEREDPVRRQRLFRGMARIILSLARIPQPRIGSFRFHNDGTITLTNRPLNSSIMLLENDGTPRTIQRDDTYQCTEPFIADLFGFHDKRFLTHPNAIFDDRGCRSEMAAKVLLHALAHYYVRRDRRNGPFLLQFDDLHASNIFVDSDWNITCLIDLEWVCALPVEKLAVPYWLTGCAIDGIIGERLVQFDQVRNEFMQIFEEEELNDAAKHGFSLAQTMRESWESGGVWFWHGMTSTNAMCPLFTDHIRPRFLSSRLSPEDESLLSNFWSEDAARIVQDKVQEYHRYEVALKGLFK